MGEKVDSLKVRSVQLLWGVTATVNLLKYDEYDVEEGFSVGEQLLFYNQTVGVDVKRMQ